MSDNPHCPDCGRMTDPDEGEDPTCFDCWKRKASPADVLRNERERLMVRVREIDALLEGT